uniref:Proteasome 26S subunit, ATPase 6 n=1 Tax=Callithrix jacchus TaxID=9483 RepID=A0A8I3WMI9_CALJA
MRDGFSSWRTLEIRRFRTTARSCLSTRRSTAVLRIREQLKELTKQYEKSENDLKALQSVGQIVGEVLKQLTEEKFIVKATNGPRYVVGCRRQIMKQL